MATRLQFDERPHEKWAQCAAAVVGAMCRLARLAYTTPVINVLDREIEFILVPLGACHNLAAAVGQQI